MTLYFEPKPERAKAMVDALGAAAKAARNIDELNRLVDGDRGEQLVVFGPNARLAEAMMFANKQRLHRPSLGVVLLRTAVDVSVLGEAIRAGVREVVDAADTEAIRTACARSLEVSRQLDGSHASDEPDSRNGQVISVFSGKGGAGKSTIATNLAIALAAEGARKVLLVDLALSFGDVAIMLQLVPERSLVDAIPMAGRLDETGLRSLLTPYVPGLDTLLAPAGPADGERVGRDLVTETLTVARQAFDYVIIDTPAVFSDQVLAALDLSDFYLLLATPDIPALKNLRLTLDMFDLLEYPKEERIVVLNRSDSRVGLTLSDIERVVRAPVNGHVPSTRDVPVSTNQGTPLMLDNPTHPVSRAIRELAENNLAVPAVDKDASPIPEARQRKKTFTLRWGR